MKIIVLKQCQKEIEEFPMAAKEKLTDYDERCIRPVPRHLFDAVTGCDLFAARFQEENPSILNSKFDERSRSGYNKYEN